MSEIMGVVLFDTEGCEVVDMDDLQVVERVRIWAGFK